MILALINPQYSEILFIELQVQYILLHQIVGISIQEILLVQNNHV